MPNVPMKPSLTIPQAHPPQADGDAFELRRLLAEAAARRVEALKLYEPMPLQQAFHASLANERIARGGNRSAKTTCAAVEVARAVTGQDPFNRYPKENGVAYCVGFSGSHIADPMWMKLGRPGAFRMIRDQFTGLWRTFRPSDPADAARKKESRKAPPLIPERMIRSIAWEEKKTVQPKLVTLTNGWQLHFYSGNAKPPQGTNCDLCWFDEELPDSEWYDEIVMRLVENGGVFIWSATPQVGTDQLYRLHERAEEQVLKNVQPRTVEEIVMHIDHNIYFTDAQRALMVEKLDDDAREIRVAGEFAGVHRVYPEWSAKYNEVAYRDIPENWTRYVGVDPGRQVCAGLFLAVPPPSDDVGQHIYIYDEFYIKKADAVMFGEAMQAKCRGQQFRAFIIDPNAAGQHEVGSGITIGDHYRKQLRDRGIYSELSGAGFIDGDDNRRAATEAIRLWIRQRASANPVLRTSTLRVIAAKCPNFVWEMKHLKYKKHNSGGKMVVTDDPDETRNTHLFACLRYLAQYSPKWHPPKQRTAILSAPYRAFQRKREKSSEGKGFSVLLGPGS